MSRDIFEAYLAGEASAFFPTHFADRRDACRAVAAARPIDRRVLDVLRAQSSRYPACSARDDSLAALAGGARAVVTGQQMGLFLGPLFTTYKAASAVRAAEALSAACGQRVVPIFWLQNEDHDLVEISTTYIPSRSGGARRITVPATNDGRCSVAHVKLPDTIAACLDALRLELGNLPHAAAHLSLLEAHYTPGATWSDAFAFTLASIFAGTGLILVDARDPELAKHAAPMHRQALSRAAELASALQKRVNDLERAGFAPMVHVRDAAPLSFYHPDGASGPRYRLSPVADGLAEVGGSRVHRLRDLLSALERDARHFSSSALLRPVVQDALLPTAAYIGGPGEISYFAQLAPLYAALSVPMPLVVPRARLRLIENKTARLCARLGVAPEQAHNDSEKLLALARVTETNGPHGATIAAALLEAFDTELARLRPSVLALGRDLDNAMDKTRASVEVAVGKLADKIERSRLHADETLVADVERLRAALYPEGMPQERYYGISYFVSRYGTRPWLEAVLAAADPFEPRIGDVRLA